MRDHNVVNKIKDIDKIRSPRLKNILKQRIYKNNSLAYNDHDEDPTPPPQCHNDHTRHNDYGDHHDYTDHNDHASYHSDYMTQTEWYLPETHSDSGGDHSDFGNNHSDYGRFHSDYTDHADHTDYHDYYVHVDGVQLGFLRKIMVDRMSWRRNSKDNRIGISGEFIFLLILLLLLVITLIW